MRWTRECYSTEDFHRITAELTIAFEEVATRFRSLAKTVWKVQEEERRRPAGSAVQWPRRAEWRWSSPSRVWTSASIRSWRSSGELGISVKTAENHRSRVMEKLGVRNVAELVRHAARRGLLG